MMITIIIATRVYPRTTIYKVHTHPHIIINIFGGFVGVFFALHTKT